MSWKEKMKEFGGGDFTFLSEDGEVLIFVVAGEPVLLEGKFKGKPSEKIGCPIVTQDGFALFVSGKRLARKISKYEDEFDSRAFMAIRHGEQNDITATYELKLLDDSVMTKQLLVLRETSVSESIITEAVASVLDVMRQ